MARPTKYNEERHRKIVETLRGGNTRRASAWAGGIDVDTFLQWLRRFPNFAEDVKAAEADAELAMVERVRTAANDQWQAAAWWLERKMKRDWSNRQEITGEDGAPVRIAVRFADEDGKDEDA
jgi:hypothetical protein